MERPLLIQCFDSWYHVMNRGRRGGHGYESKPDAILSRCRRYLNGVYVQRSNSARLPDGHFFRGGYKTNVAAEDWYSLQLVRYIDRNPAGAVILRVWLSGEASRSPHVPGSRSLGRECWPCGRVMPTLAPRPLIVMAVTSGAGFAGQMPVQLCAPVFDPGERHRIQPWGARRSASGLILLAVGWFDPWVDEQWLDPPDSEM